MKELGYDQFLSITIEKKGIDSETLLLALGIHYSDLLSFLNDEGEFDTFEERVRWTINGKSPLWDEDKLEARWNLQEISKELECSISIYYEGEEKEDAEQKTWLNGKLIMWEILGWVDKLAREKE